MSDKKKMQLGMNPSTAANRLVKDILWRLIVETEQDECCKCGFPMTRDTFSIEHLEPWLDSEDPIGLYFSQENIGFSHLRCNVGDARSAKKKYDSPEEAYQAKLKQSRERRRETYCPDWRKQRYTQTGY